MERKEFGYYRQMSQSEQAEEIQYMYAVGILGRKMHAWNTCMFYGYTLVSGF